MRRAVTILQLASVILGQNPMTVMWTVCPAITYYNECQMQLPFREVINLWLRQGTNPEMSPQSQWSCGQMEV